MRYVIPFDNLVTGATGDAYTTAAALIVPDTVGLRGRLVELGIGPADDAPQDLNVNVVVQRIADVSAGTAGTKTAIAAADMPKVDPAGPACRCSGGLNYSAEPTTFETYPLFSMGVNLRGGFFKQWSREEAPSAGQDQLLAVRVAPRTSAAKGYSGYAVFEVD